MLTAPWSVRGQINQILFDLKKYLFLIYAFFSIFTVLNTKIEFTIHYTRQITALNLSRYTGLYALSRPRSNLHTIWPLNSFLTSKTREFCLLGMKIKRKGTTQFRFFVIVLLQNGTILEDNEWVFLQPTLNSTKAKLQNLYTGTKYIKYKYLHSI